MEFKNKLICAAIICSAAFAPRLTATEIVTTSFSAWTATLTDTPVEWDFAFSNGGSYSTATGYTLSAGSYGPLNVTGPDGSGYVLNEAYYGSSNSPVLQGASDGLGSMVFTTPAAGLTGMLLGLGISGNAAPVTVTLSDGESFTVNPAVDGSVLLGLSSATNITSFTLTTTSGSAVDLTDFYAADSNQTDSGSPTAEVATALMIGTGLLFIATRRKVFCAFSKAQA
jgi:hypothetical protein